MSGLCLLIMFYATPMRVAAAGAMDTAAVETEHRFTTALPLFGQVESTRAVNIPARTEGLIVQIGVTDETAVKQGDMLFELAGQSVENRATDLRQQLIQANAEVAIAQKNLRLKRSQRQQGLATNEQVNAAKNALSLANAHASTTRRALLSLHAGTKIVAPTDGIFTGRTVHVGQYVSAGMLLARIVDTSHMRIRASLFPTPVINPLGKEVKIDAPEMEAHAKVTRVMPERTAEGAVQVWIEGDNLQGLAPGMQVSGIIEVEHQALAVPEDAIAMDDRGRTFVFIQMPGDWRKQRVVMGLHDQRLVEIVSGLRGDERVATKNAYQMLFQNFSKMYRAPD